MLEQHTPDALRAHVGTWLCRGLAACALGTALLLLAVSAQRLGPAALQARAAEQVQPLLGTLKDLVAVESGSRDLEGLATLAQLVASRLQAAGMKTELIDAKAPDFHPQLKGAKLGSMIYGTKSGTGKRRVLLIAHMDTVYERGMGAKQPFRIDGDRAYGLGIADDRPAWR